MPNQATAPPASSAASHWVALPTNLKNKDKDGRMEEQGWIGVVAFLAEARE
jgi:hypothetical protein